VWKKPAGSLDKVYIQKAEFKLDDKNKVVFKLNGSSFVKAGTNADSITGWTIE
jgi:hypothetical protein